MRARPYGSGYLAVSLWAVSSIVSMGQNSVPIKDTAAYPSRSSTSEARTLGGRMYIRSISAPPYPNTQKQ